MANPFFELAGRWPMIGTVGTVGTNRFQNILFSIFTCDEFSKGGRTSAVLPPWKVLKIYWAFFEVLERDFWRHKGLSGKES